MLAAFAAWRKGLVLGVTSSTDIEKRATSCPSNISTNARITALMLMSIACVHDGEGEGDERDEEGGTEATEEERSEETTEGDEERGM